MKTQTKLSSTSCKILSLTIEKTPEMVQTIKETLTLPVCLRTPAGDTNIPEPIILPTITVIPLIKLIFGFNVISSSFFDVVVVLSSSMIVVVAYRTFCEMFMKCTIENDGGDGPALFRTTTRTVDAEDQYMDHFILFF